MEKQLSAVGYWLGLICTALALIFRMLTVFTIATPHMGVSRRQRHWLLEFLARCRAIFFGVNCELVPDCKILGQSPKVSDSIADLTAKASILGKAN